MAMKTWRLQAESHDSASQATRLSKTKGTPFIQTATHILNIGEEPNSKFKTKCVIT